MPIDLLNECRRRTVVGDGAMGTELQRAGLEPGESGERWNLDHPDRIETIQRAYVEAGSEILLTNSFGANRWVLGRYALEDQVAEINRAAVRIARRAAGTRALVLGDIGPSGLLFQPLGDLAPDEAREAFQYQAGALLDAGADGIVVETMTALEEAVAAVQAARAAGAPFVIATMAYDRQPAGGYRTMMGVAPEQAARALGEAGAAIVGANCGTRLTLEDAAALAGIFRSASSRPVIVQPNAGQPELEDGRTVYRLSPADFARGMQAVVAGGAGIVGGCCGTTPAHIRALAESVQAATR